MLKVQSTNVSNIGFKASINKNTSSMKTACSYMERCKDYELPYANTKTELEVFGLIEKALAKHPSREVLNIYRYNDKRFFWDERGMIKSSKASFVDVEPVRDDSIAGELGIIRRILDPENKDMFNQLLGVEHSSKYDKWWKKYIAPIWPNINLLYRENPAIEPNVTDKQYNECFRKQIDIYESTFINEDLPAEAPNKDKPIVYETREVVSAFAVCMAVVITFLSLINRASNKKFQAQKEIINTELKDSLKNISKDTLDLTKHFIK